MEKETESETERRPKTKLVPDYCPKCARLIHRCICQRNDVHSQDFESKMDDFFTSKTKEKDTWVTRKCSIKLFGQWT